MSLVRSESKGHSRLSIVLTAEGVEGDEALGAKKIKEEARSIGE